MKTTSAGGAREVLSPWRLFLYALALMPVMSLPYFALFHGIFLPGSSFFLLPVWAIDSFAMIFHENGHMVTQWLFGQPSGMRFYPEMGGAVTYSGQFQPWLLALFYVEMALLGLWLHFKKKDRAFRLWCVLIFLHAVFAATPLHRALGMYMGHGAEILCGTFIAWLALFRGERWNVPGGWIAESAWRLAWVAAGIYMIWENALQMTEMMLSIPQNIVIAAYSNKRVINDIQQAARVLDIPVPVSAGVVFAFAIACIAFLGYQARSRIAGS